MAKQWTKADILSPTFSYSNVAKGDTLLYEGVVYTYDGAKFVPPAQTATQQASGPSLSLNVSNPIDRGDTTAAAFQEAAADASREQQERAQVDAQRGYQIGARDPRVEADKDAAARSAAMFNQQVAQQSAASGAGAAVLASMNTVDPTATLAENRARGDAQHLVGAQHQLTAETARQQELAKRNSAEEFNRLEGDRIAQNAQATQLSLGGNNAPSSQPASSSTPAQGTQEQNQSAIPAPAQKTKQSPAPPQLSTAELNKRVEAAISDVTDKSKLAPLRAQGFGAIKAFYSTPSNKALWEQFRKAVVAAGGTPVNADPAISKVAGTTTQYNEEGTPVSSEATPATETSAPTQEAQAPAQSTPAPATTVPPAMRNDPDYRNIIDGIRTRF